MKAYGESDQAYAYRLRAIEDLERRIPHQGYVWGVGTRQPNGSVNIVRELASWRGLPELFVRNYAKVADQDVVGMLFAAFPKLTFRVSVSDYEGLVDKLPSMSGLAEYLRSSEIHHLMLAGLEIPSAGLAWVTLYRRRTEDMAPGEEPPPFSAEDEACARYVVPYHLYEWLSLLPRQHSEVPKEDEATSLKEDAAALLWMKPQEALIAAMLAHQLPVKIISKLTGLNSGQIYDSHKAYSKRTGLKQQIDMLVLARLLGPSPSQRS